MTMPVWGCPWHGPVRSARLELPNGSFIDYPQPSSIFTVVSGVPTLVADTGGAAHRLFVPGTPAVMRSEEELASDEEVGRQWRNEAILAGARLDLHGKNLDGWIYIDPDGTRWRVTCAQLDEDVVRSLAGTYSGTLVLERFGDFGRAAESYSYPFSCAWGIDGSSAPTSARVRLDALRSDGGAGIIMVHERRLSSDETQIRWPHSFLELSISGPGAEADVSCSVVKTRSQVSSATRSYDPGPRWLAGYYNGPPTFVPAWRVQLESTPPGPGEGNFSEWGGRVCWNSSGEFSLTMRRVLTIWYDTSGNKQSVDFVLSCEGEFDNPAPTPTGVTVTSTAEWTASIEVGGVAYSHIDGSWDITGTETLTPPSNTGTYSQSGVNIVDGVSIPSTASGSSAPFAWITANLSYANIYLTSSESLMTWRVETGATTFSGRLAVARYSPQLIGLATQRTGAYSFLPPVSPSGVAPGSAQVATKQPYCGSWSPYTGEIAWLELAAVCWV